MRVLDISGLVSLHKYFARAARAAAYGAGGAAFVSFSPDFPDRMWTALLAVLSAGAWFVLSRGRAAAARAVVPALLVLIFYLLWRHRMGVAAPPPDFEEAMPVLLAMYLYIPLHAGLGLLLPAPRAASGSPHVQALFARVVGEGLHARLERALRGIGLLPVLVVCLMLLALVALIAILDPETREVSPATRRTMTTVLATVGGGALLWARRRSAPRGAEVLRVDRRPPVLLLRSFGDDMMELETGAKYTRANDLLRQGLTFERIVANQLGTLGPVVAIGRPGEALAPLGAARDYVADDEWQRVVEQSMQDAALIVLVLGNSEGLAWELVRVQRLRLLRKLVLLFPPAPNLEERWLTLRMRDMMAGSAMLPEELEPSRVLALVWDDAERPLALEGPRTEWAYETALRLAAAWLPGVGRVTSGRLVG